MGSTGGLAPFSGPSLEPPGAHPIQRPNKCGEGVAGAVGTSQGAGGLMTNLRGKQGLAVSNFLSRTFGGSAKGNASETLVEPWLKQLAGAIGRE